MSPSSLYDALIVVQQIHLVTKCATLADDKHQFSQMLTWVIDAPENVFLRTMRSSLNIKRTWRKIQSKEGVQGCKEK